MYISGPELDPRFCGLCAVRSKRRYILREEWVDVGWWQGILLLLTRGQNIEYSNEEQREATAVLLWVI